MGEGLPEKPDGGPALGLRLFCFALMGPACGINAVFIALAIPAMAAFGEAGLIAAGMLGVLIGILPSRWLSRRIHEGLKDPDTG